MIYIYRRQASNGARDLAAKLQEMGVDARKISKPPNRPGQVVCWGSVHGDLDGCLNNVPLRSKFHDAEDLTAAGIPTILASLQPSADCLLGRLNSHVGGSDLLNPPSQPDYWVRREVIRQEYRIHIFDGKSIRAGVKIPRSGVQPHEWIRSWQAGWMIAYTGSGIKQAWRDLAREAVECLQLDFGAVDIGILADRSAIVLEVNRAPGLEGRTIDAYARAIQGYFAPAS